jgi:RHS repeat-associated protein
LTESKFGVSGETAESTIKYEYDNGNRLTKVIDSISGTFTPEYDELNRLKSLATPNGMIKYEYDEANRRTSMTVPGQEAVKYTYDEANRLKELTRGTQKVSFAYDEANRPTKTTLVDGVEENYGYDTANELTSIAYKKGSTTLGELDYSYNTNSGREAVWGSYARTGLPEAISSATYNADNEQTERNSTKLSYDANGNLTSDGTNEYKWNARNQLAEITGGTKATFEYDPFGRRISKTIGGTTTKTLYDGANAVQETKGSATANLLTGLSTDKTFARTTSTATESFLTDALGSTIALAGSTAKVETTYTYDPFGNTTKEGTASENPFQYAGRENDGDGLYYNRARYYSPVSTRFISQDPLGQEANEPSGNVYLYAGDSPTNATDPYGTNLGTPSPGPGPGSGEAGGGGGGSGGGGGGGSGAGATPGGFGAGPTPGGPGSGGCSPGSKGPGLQEAARCKSYEKLEQAEEELRKSYEKPTEYGEGVKEREGKILEGCGTSAAGSAAAGAMLGSPGGPAGSGAAAAAAAVPGCAAGAGVEVVKIFEERALEL